jgi:2-octaprenyl-3-methyl-6-methoxy-1,4-benzoquinol hydroxylase
VIRSALERQENITNDRVLARYQQKRKTDNLLIQSGMDLFYKAFKEDILPLKALRNLALVATDTP